MEMKERLAAITQKYGEEAVREITTHVLVDLEEKGFITNCTSFNPEPYCDGPKCGANQSCREYAGKNCYCTNN